MSVLPAVDPAFAAEAAWAHTKWNDLMKSGIHTVLLIQTLMWLRNHVAYPLFIQ